MKLKTILKGRKPRKSPSILGMQKPIKKNKSFFKLYLRPMIGITLASIFPILGVFVDSKLNTSIKKIHFIDQSQRLTTKRKKMISKKLENYLKSHRKNSLIDLSNLISHWIPSESVSIIRPQRDSVVISIKEKKPYLGLKLKKFYYITEGGSIYRKHRQAKIPVITLYGVSPKKMSFKPGKGYQIDNETKIILLEAIKLRQGLDRENLSITSIVYEKYRGFKVTTNQNMTVTFGRGPFDSRIRRLKETIGRLIANGIEAKQIELDYNGKAFIIEKKNNI